MQLSLSIERSKQLQATRLGGLSNIALAILTLLFIVPVSPDKPAVFLFSCLTATIGIVTLALGQAKRLKAAITTITFGTVVVLTIVAGSYRGTYGPEPAGCLIVVALGALVLSARQLGVLVLFSEASLALMYAVRLPLVPDGFERQIFTGAMIAQALMVAVAAIVSFQSQRYRDEALGAVAINEAELAERNAQLEHEIGERQRAEEAAHTRARALEAMLDVSTSITSTLELDKLLTLITAKMRTVIDFDSLTVTQFGARRVANSIFASGPDEYRAKLHQSHWQYQPEIDLDVTELLRRNEPVYTPDLAGDDIIAQGKRGRMIRFFGHLPDYARAYVAAPLRVRGEVVGYMCLTSAQPNTYTDRSAGVIMAFASLISASVEKAQLYERSLETAALGERSRIARELHDSVSQALFGIVLGMRTMLHGMESEGRSAPEAAQYVLSLSEAALSETRALVFELRPEYLEKEGLRAALRKQADALCARHKIDVRADLGNVEPAISIEAKEMLYRITLEAIQNTIKHARASVVLLGMTQDDSGLTVTIEDNGIGFDPTARFDGHYGLRTMRERAVQRGARIDVTSASGHGTRISVRLPLTPTQQEELPAAPAIAELAQA